MTGSHALLTSLLNSPKLQEGVAIEIAEAVVGALKGELAATAVNAPMVPAEVRSFSRHVMVFTLFFREISVLTIQLREFLDNWI
jgi:hypothetical protein